MCYKSSWPCVLAPAITGLTVPFFCSVPWSFPLCLRLACSEQAGCSLVSLQLFPCSAPLQWPRSLAALFKQGNTFLQFLWQEWDLPQGSKPLFLSSPSPFTALWCNVCPWLLLKRLGPRPAHPRTLSYYCQKTMAKPLPKPGPSIELTPSMCLVSWGSSTSTAIPSLLIHGKTHLRTASPKPSFREQSFPMGGTIVCFQNIITCMLKIATRWLASCENKFQC